MKFIKINGESLSRQPTSIEQRLVKLKKEDRTIDGTLVVDIIGIKNKIKVQWDYISSTDMSKLQYLIAEKDFLTISYQNGKKQENVIAETSELSYTPYYDSRTKSIIWKGVSLEFSEV